MNKRRSLSASISVHGLGFRAACFVAAVGGFFALCFAASSTAQPTPVVIDFEDLQPVTVLSQYANRGVTFNGPSARDYSQTPGFTHSGTKAIELCFAAEFCTTPLNITFTAGQAHVKLWVGYSAPLPQARTVVLRALDRKSVPVGQASVVLSQSTGPIPVQNPLQINSATANI